MLRNALLLVLVVACASTSSRQDVACRDSVTNATQVENTLAMMDAMCVGDAFPNDAQWPVHSYACVAMGDVLTTGRCGMPRDPERAKRYYDRACTRGYQPACNARSRLAD